ncbi:Putative L,D-transpeptidase LppS precursor [Corynebacterium comes]|uniref:L,D-transpeptidase LppS n=2 Tax=Corynebacterium comes TaxID=2675218 RepID=A0A6B8VVL8_9CORY|nr:Putative L,D-transpeptidase LppS precursor [Corynebacterium comes]
MKFRIPLAGRGSAVLMVAALTVGTLTGCTIDRASSVSETQSRVVESAAAPEISVRDGAEDVDPSRPVTVTSAEGLKKVTMTNQDGKVVESELSTDGTQWSTAEVLGYHRTYTITAEDRGGQTATTTFSTVSPVSTTGVALAPLEDSTVGVAQTITLRFGTAVKDRQAAQDAITITTSPEVEGAFYWLNNSELRWRPKEFWTPGTRVDVRADVYGADLGGGVYGSQDNGTSFTIGEDVRTVVDDATKSMTVYRNGEALRTIPVSLGADKWATPNGTYVIGDRHESLVMDSTTFGLAYDQGGYRTEVDYATQMSWSGIYVHAAPWSVGDQGRRNVSHGCINVTTEAAAWFQDVVKRGDPVEVRNTVGDVLSGYDGLGDWNIPWETWRKGNADDTSSW